MYQFLVEKVCVGVRFSSVGVRFAELLADYRIICQH